MSFEWLTLSKAFEKSGSIRSVCLPDLIWSEREREREREKREKSEKKGERRERRVWLLYFVLWLSVFCVSSLR